MDDDRIALLRKLSSPTTNQDVIANALGVQPACVGKWQRKLDLPRPRRGVRHTEGS